MQKLINNEQKIVNRIIKVKLMVEKNSFVFRKGKIGEKLPSVCLQDKNLAPDFVLELNGKLTVTACTMGIDNHIYAISSFDENKDYITKFLELWEEYTRNKKHPELIVSHIKDSTLEQILVDKRKFSRIFEDDRGKVYLKDLTAKT